MSGQETRLTTENGASAVDSNKVEGNEPAPQFDYDPIQRGLSLTVDSSPRGHRNMSVLKAKLREAESKYMLELTRYKNEAESKHLLELQAFQKESDTERGQLREQIRYLKLHENKLETKLAQETADKEELVQGKNQLKLSLATLTEKFEKLQAGSSNHLTLIQAAADKLSTWQNKCSELEGRLSESRAAHETSRLHMEQVLDDHEQQIIFIREECSQSKSNLEAKLRSRDKDTQHLEIRLQETNAAYKRSVAEIELISMEKYDTIEKFKAEADQREIEYKKHMDAVNKRLDGQIEKLTMISDLCDRHVQKSAQNKEQYELTLEQLRTEHEGAISQWETKEQTLNQKVTDMTAEIEQLEKQNAEKSETLATNQKKYDDAITVLKQTLSVIDDQNKDLANEVESIRTEFKDNMAQRQELDLKLGSLRKELLVVQAEKQDLTETKIFLDNELNTVRQVMVQEAEQKATEIKTLQNDLAEAKNTMAQAVELREAKIAKLNGQLEDAAKCHLSAIEQKTKEGDKLSKRSAELMDQCEKLKEEQTEASIQMVSVKEALEAKVDDFEHAKEQIAKLNLEVNRLIGMIVTLKEDNIELKSGLNEAIQKTEFYKERNEVLSKEISNFKRDGAEKEAELEADIEEKRRVIEYLQAQSTSAATTEKKKRRFFGNTSPKSEKPQKKDDAKNHQ